MYLTADISSSINRKILYGHKGEKVSIKGNHGSVAIVETIEKQGFPVNVEYLSPIKK